MTPARSPNRLEFRARRGPSAVASDSSSGDLATRRRADAWVSNVRRSEFQCATATGPRIGLEFCGGAGCETPKRHQLPLEIARQVFRAREREDRSHVRYIVFVFEVLSGFDPTQFCQETRRLRSRGPHLGDPPSGGGDDPLTRCDSCRVLVKPHQLVDNQSRTSIGWGHTDPHLVPLARFARLPESTRGLGDAGGVRYSVNYRGRGWRDEREGE